MSAGLATKWELLVGDEPYPSHRIEASSEAGLLAEAEDVSRGEPDAVVFAIRWDLGSDGWWGGHRLAEFENGRRFEPRS